MNGLSSLIARISLAILIYLSIYYREGTNVKAISLKLDERQLKALDEVSRATRIPKSALVRKGIDLVLQQAKEDVITADLRREIDDLLQEDSRLLKRLSKA